LRSDVKRCGYWLQQKHRPVVAERVRSLLAAVALQFSLQGAAKKKIQALRRGPFKTWKWQLLGSTALLHMVLCHGIFDTGEQRRFLLAYETRFAITQQDFQKLDCFIVPGKPGCN